MLYDLLLKGGRILDPGQNLDFIADLAIKDKKILSIHKNISSEKAKRIIDVSGKMVVPGLIDFHTHVYWGGTALGIKPDPLCFKTGVTTMVDAGSAGAGNIEGFKKFVIEKSRCNIMAFLNIAYPGICCVGKSMNIPEISNLQVADYSEALRAGRKFDKVICGIKVRCCSVNGNSMFGIEPVRIAKSVAKELKKPLMVHNERANPVTSREIIQEILDLLEKGDILTHCFSRGNSIISEEKGLLPEVLDAKRRGVLFCVGHGSKSFSFDITKKAIHLDFLPDIISSDIHIRSIEGPVYDLLTTMSKFIPMGMSIYDIIRAVTYKPAQALGRTAEIGTLKIESDADVAVLDLEKGTFKFEDGEGKILRSNRRFLNHVTILKGKIVKPLLL